MIQKMENKRVLVTGSGTGIGSGIALEFAKDGAAVAVHYSHSAEGAASVVEQIHEVGGRAKAFQADFVNIEQSIKLVHEAVDFLGGLDVLINNAGITANIPFEKVTFEQFNTIFNVNFASMYFTTQAAVETMFKQGAGVVINISSVHAYQGMHEHTVYDATKGAIISFTRALAVELGPKNIRVNAIAPGAVRVPNYEKADLPEKWEEELARCLPVGFIAEPRDIGRLCIFLSSEEARFICGQTIVSDGGQIAVMARNDDFRTPTESQFGRGYVPGLR